MKLFFSLLLLTGLALAAEPEFEVDTLKPLELAALDAAEEDVDLAMKALAAAQKRLREARERQAKAKGYVESRVGVFNGKCAYPEVTSTGIYIAPTRRYRRIEIRGRYVLITTGEEACGGLSWYGTATGTTADVVLRNTTTLPDPHFVPAVPLYPTP